MTAIYLPVADKGVLRIATQWNDEAVRAGKVGYTIITNTSTGFVKTGRRLLGKGALRMHPSNERLYVMIHGDDTLSDNSFSVSATRNNGEDKSYTPQTLARHLHKEGLSTALTDLRLAVCNGGRADDVGDSFASIFKAWMVHFGYQNLTVYGYVGNVRSDRAQLDDGSWVKYARIAHIDTSGNQVDEFYRLKDTRVAF